MKGEDEGGMEEEVLSSQTTVLPPPRSTTTTAGEIFCALSHSPYGILAQNFFLEEGKKLLNLLFGLAKRRASLAVVEREPLPVREEEGPFQETFIESPWERSVSYPLPSVLCGKNTTQSSRVVECVLTSQ